MKRLKRFLIIKSIIVRLKVLFKQPTASSRRLQIPHLHISIFLNFHIFTFSHLHIFKSPHLHISTSSHLHISTSSHLHISTFPHLQISTFPHLQIDTKLFRIANLIKSAVVLSSSFCMMWFLCAPTVLALINSFSAISALV